MEGRLAWVPAPTSLTISAVFGPTAERSAPYFTLRTSASNAEAVPGQRLTLTMDFEMAPGHHAYAPGLVEYQVCSDTICYRPGTLPVSWSLRVRPLDRERAPEALRRPPNLDARRRVGSVPFIGTLGNRNDGSAVSPGVRPLVQRLGLAGALAIAAAPTAGSKSATAPGAPDLSLFAEAAAPDEKRARVALDALAASWRDGYSALIIDLARFMRSGRPHDVTGENVPLLADDDGAVTTGRSDEPFARARRPDPSSFIRARLLRFLENQTGQRHGDDLRAWRRWIWSLDYDPHPDYGRFKAILYSRIDARMAAFFPPGVRSDIRLDEVDWGGVTVNGIPPLDHPRHVPAHEAGWLKDNHVVFGIALGGEARAYPKRVLAWHELARDRVGGVELAIVYCTLCGTVVPYGTEVDGVRRTFGTSGLLYRSNKLLFDEGTMSLWSTLEGRPVIGPLVGSGLDLRAYPVVTTTWREWRDAHPGTTVLSRETGHERDYSEGAAYRSYFATDELMFEVPRTDRRLRNKDEVLGLLLPPRGAGPNAPRRAVALSVELLERQPVRRLSFGGHDLVVVTSPEGANRVYEASGTAFVRRLAKATVEDAGGGRWTVMEDALVSLATGERRPRVPARRAFWFGWFAQFPETELVK